jgi:hypothetical protein
MRRNQNTQSAEALFRFIGEGPFFEFSLYEWSGPTCADSLNYFRRIGAVLHRHERRTFIFPEDGSKHDYEWFLVEFVPNPIVYGQGVALREMTKTEQAQTMPIERLFCSYCGHDGAYDCTGEGDWVCGNETCDHSVGRGHRYPFISPLRERDLHATELIRLRLENHQLREQLLRLKG